MDAEFAQDFEIRRQKMSDFIKQTKNIFADAGYQTEVFEDAGKHLINSKFKVLVIGAFKRGKSTFINALLGEKILPSASKPCTAIISEVKYGKEKSAVIYFKDNIKDVPEGLSEEACDYINKHKSKGKIPPLTVPFEKLKDYVTITDATKDQEESVSESPFARAEIFVELDLCKNGVEIIDSPGLNEHKTRDAVANGYVGKSDAIIFVLSCKSLADQMEMQDIKDFEAMGNKSIFFVCNQFDELKEEEDQAKIKEYAQKKLLPHTDLGSRGLHFVSARHALNARTKLNPPDVQKCLEDASGFLEMEQCLKDFLVNDRGRVKLAKPGEMLLEQLNNNFPRNCSGEEKILEKDMEQVIKNRNVLKKNLQRIRREAQKSIENLSACVSEIKTFYREELLQAITSLSGNMKVWVEECFPLNGLGLVFTTKADIEAVTKELVEYAAKCAETRLQEWNETEFKPAIEERIDDFRKKAHAAIANFQEYMNEADAEFADFNEAGENYTLEGFLRANGLDEDLLGDTLKLYIAGGIVFALAGVFAWWVLLPALFFAGAQNHGHKMDKLKKKVGAELENAVRDKALEYVSSKEKIAFIDKLQERVELIEKAFDREIREADEKAAIAEDNCRKSKSEVDARKLKLNDLRKKASSLAENVRLFMAEINRREISGQ